MATVTIFEAAAVNDALAQEGLAYRVHLHDMCGAQQFSVEELDAGKDAQQGAHDADALRAAVARHFAAKGMTVSFAPDGGLTFRVQ